MSAEALNFTQKLTLFSKHWAPNVVDEMYDYQFKLVKLHGEFVWQQHGTTDEVFIVLNGDMIMGS